MVHSSKPNTKPCYAQKLHCVACLSFAGFYFRLHSPSLKLRRIVLRSLGEVGHPRSLLRGIRRSRITTRQGLGLFEVMVTTLLSAAILAGIYTAFMVGERAWGYYVDSIMIRQQVRMALLGLTHDLREASGALVVKEEDPPSVRLNFFKPSVGGVSYLWNGSGENANKLIRQDDSGARVVANNISSIDYVVTGDLIFVDISAASKPRIGQPMALNLKEQVALRAKTSRFKPQKGAK